MENPSKTRTFVGEWVLSRRITRRVIEGRRIVVFGILPSEIAAVVSVAVNVTIGSFITLSTSFLTIRRK